MIVLQVFGNGQETEVDRVEGNLVLYHGFGARVPRTKCGSGDIGFLYVSA